MYNDVQLHITWQVGERQDATTISWLCFRWSMPVVRKLLKAPAATLFLMLSQQCL